MYGTLEEEHGLAKRAMSVYDRATLAVENADRMEVRLVSLAFHNSILILDDRCLRTISPKRRPTLDCPRRDRSTNVLSSNCRIDKLPKCVYDSPLSRESWEKLIELELSLLTRRNSVILEYVHLSPSSRRRLEADSFAIVESGILGYLEFVRNRDRIRGYVPRIPSN